MNRKSSPPTGRICPCGCDKPARPGDPGFGQRLTVFGKSGYWRRRCIQRLRAEERAALDTSTFAYPPGAEHSVARYFIDKLGAGQYGDKAFQTIGAWEIPLRSECGRECRKAINAGGALLGHVENATGTDYPERNEAVRRIVFHIIGTYICG